jgi:cardiolipin synthase A/B
VERGVEFLWSHLSLLLAIIERSIAIATSIHAVLYKRETHNLTGWLGLIWLSPLVGSSLYIAFGINRIRRRGSKVQSRLNQVMAKINQAMPRLPIDVLANAQRQQLPFAERIQLGDRLLDRPLVPVTRAEPLQGGDLAYEKMLAAIDAAKRTIALQTYIFDNDETGRLFVNALAAAQSRGVKVRVLLDDVGSRYSHPRIQKEFRKQGIECASFLPTLAPRVAHYANLRNHRKLLIVDGVIGFTGGMNIRDGHRANRPGGLQIDDVHFCFEGAIAGQMQESFATDWAFVTNEILDPQLWFVEHNVAGDTWVRGITDGPDEHSDHIRLTLLGALASARTQVQIVTPYFLPDIDLIGALKVACLRGIHVRIILPERNNIALVDWAGQQTLAELVRTGIQVSLSPPPFDHSKLVTVDQSWALVGSSNWDPRSLRLNFEYNVECYGYEFCSSVRKIIEGKIHRARSLTNEDFERLAFLIRIRNGLARLATPLL